MFVDRNDAGKKLALLLEDYIDTNTIIFALPRGGVVLGYEIAKSLNLPLELIITKKIGHRDYPEFAIGAVSESGRYVLNESEFLDTEWLKQEIKIKQQEAIKKKKLYYKNRQEMNVEDKIVIIVDDGVATGTSISLAIDEIKIKKPKKIIVAVPVISKSTANYINKISDKLLALEIVDDYFGSVGNYYKNFYQVSDKEVIKLISKIWQKK